MKRLGLVGTANANRRPRRLKDGPWDVGGRPCTFGEFAVEQAIEVLASEALKPIQAAMDAEWRVHRVLGVLQDLLAFDAGSRRPEALEPFEEWAGREIDGPTLVARVTEAVHGT